MAKVENDQEPTESEPLSQEVHKADQTRRRYSYKEKFQQMRSNITVEPCVLIFIMTAMLCNMANQNLNLEKACRVNLNFTQEICDALEQRNQTYPNYKNYETQVQKLITFTATWKSVIVTVIPSTMILFIGAYSDVTQKRKLFVVLPAVGEFLGTMGNLVSVYYFFELPLEVLAFTEVAFTAMTGGWCCLFMGAFSYISDITSEKNRTFRMGVVSFCISVGFPLGMGLSGIILNRFGFKTLYFAAGALQFLLILYGFFWLKDPVRKREVRRNTRLLDFSRIMETLNVLCAGTNARKHRIWLLLFTVCMIFGPMYGEISVLYLMTRIRFNWEAIAFSIFLTYNFLVHLVGTVFSIVVLSKILKWHDSLLGIISTFSKIAGALLSAFAATATIFYYGPLVEILNGTGLLVCRSMLSKAVSTEEQGKINSMVSLFETLMPLLYTPLYNKIYSLTMNVYPGAVFLLSAGLTFIPFIVYIYIFVDHRRKVARLGQAHQQSKSLP